MKQPIEDKNAPWRDRGTLERLYVEERMTQAEIGERFDVAQKTISRWLKRHGVTHPWQDEETMRELYEERMLTMPEIGERLNCTTHTVSTWVRQHGIETRGRLEESNRVKRKQPLNQRTNRRGYEVFQTKINGDDKELRVHRLTAVAEYGFDAVSGKLVHHKNGIPWDNRPGNLEPMTAEEHGKLHSPVEMRWGNSTPREQYQTDI